MASQIMVHLHPKWQMGQPPTFLESGTWRDGLASRQRLRLAVGNSPEAVEKELKDIKEVASHIKSFDQANLSSSLKPSRTRNQTRRASTTIFDSHKLIC